VRIVKELVEIWPNEVCDRKNLMEFCIRLSYYFILLYKWQSHGHMICLLKFLCYLYLDPIVHLDVVDQMFKCAGNYFLLGALITITSGNSIASQNVLSPTVDPNSWLHSLRNCTGY